MGRREKEAGKDGETRHGEAWSVSQRPPCLPGPALTVGSRPMWCTAMDTFCTMEAPPATVMVPPPLQGGGWTASPVSPRAALGVLGGGCPGLTWTWLRWGLMAVMTGFSHVLEVEAAMHAAPLLGYTHTGTTAGRVLPGTAGDAGGPERCGRSGRPRPAQTRFPPPPLPIIPWPRATHPPAPAHTGHHFPHAPTAAPAPRPSTPPWTPPLLSDPASHLLQEASPEIPSWLPLSARALTPTALKALLPTPNPTGYS